MPWILLAAAGLLAAGGVLCAVRQPPARPRLCPCLGCADQRWADAGRRTARAAMAMLLEDPAVIEAGWDGFVRGFQREEDPVWGSRPCGCARARYADGTVHYVLCRDCEREEAL